MEGRKSCSLCGSELIVKEPPVGVVCSFCGKESKAAAVCPEGHYLCEACAALSPEEVTRQVLDINKTKSPSELFELLVSHPSMGMHGVHHHWLIPLVIVAACRNAGKPVPEKAFLQAFERGSQVPGGWCAFCGACGAAVGVGIAVSAVSGATPFRGKERSLAMEATARTAETLLDNAPRCCKKAGRKAMTAAVSFFREKLGVEMEEGKPPVCRYVSRNNECAREACPYYPKS